MLDHFDVSKPKVLFILIHYIVSVWGTAFRFLAMWESTVHGPERGAVADAERLKVSWQQYTVNVFLSRRFASLSL